MASSVLDTLLGSAVLSAVLAGALGFAWRAYRQPYLGYWAAFWGAYAVVWPLSAIHYAVGASGQGAVALLLQGVTAAGGVAARLLLGLGVLAYLGLPFRRRRALAAIALATLALSALQLASGLLGLPPDGPALLFRGYTLGTVLFLALAIAVARAAAEPEQRFPRLLLAAALVAAALSDGWDVVLDLQGGAFAPDSEVALRLSMLGSHLSDALFATGMMAAAIGTERHRAEAAHAALRRNEARMHEAQRVETVGRLAGGLAHDFNNLLTAVIANLSFAAERLPADAPLRDDLSAAQLAADRAARLVRQLLTFARRQTVEPKELDLNESVRALARIVAPLVGERIGVSLRLAPRLGPVRVDPGQLEQLVVNLVINARDAMPDGGTLTIETYDLTLGSATRPAGTADLEDGEWVALAVDDTGHGMDDATRGRLFEPFFTTKASGHGTGLGLATVQSIVVQAGGAIRVRTAPGEGTRFTVYLPRAAAGTATAPSDAAAAARVAGSETVLLAEDDPAIRSIAARALSERGFRVIAAEDGARALAAAERHLATLALLVSDVVMPEMGGRELAIALRVRRPGLPVLFVSGYADGALDPDDPALGAWAFLPKPFTPSQLAEKVREVLDAASAPRRAG